MNLLITIEWGKIIGETIGMTFLSTLLAYVIGLPLGILLKNSSAKGIRPNKPLNLILGTIVNFLRSIPCLILTVILLPLTRAIMGRGTGEWYTMIIPLFFSTFAFVSRLVEQSLNDVDSGVVEMAKSMGASNWKIITKVYLPEARSSLLTGVALTLVNVIGYTAFAYNLGAGGVIGEVWNFYTKNTRTFTESWEFWVLILIAVLLVTIIQEAGLALSKKLDKRRIAK